jgi:hypothetical protein
MAEQPKAPEIKLPDLLTKLVNPPSPEQIEKWKLEFGEVYISGFSESELYVWRPLTRPEYVQIHTMMANPDAQMDQYKLEEMICNTCILYPSSPHDWDKGKAGTPQTLSEQVMQNSNFLSPAAASMLVAKL